MSIYEKFFISSLCLYSCGRAYTKSREFRKPRKSILQLKSYVYFLRHQIYRAKTIPNNTPTKVGYFFSNWDSIWIVLEHIEAYENSWRVIQNCFNGLIITTQCVKVKCRFRVIINASLFSLDDVRCVIPRWC